jgi:ribosomal protein S8
MKKHSINILSSIRACSLYKKEKVACFSNSFSFILLKLLYKEGYIQSYQPFLKNTNCTYKKSVLIFIRYNFNKSVFKKLKLISTNCNPKYVKFTTINRMFFKKDTFIFLTSQGLLTGLECKTYKLGGTLLFIC